MAEVNIYDDPMVETLTVWFGAPRSGSLRDRQTEYLCEKTGEVIGFEKLNYNLAANTNLKIFLETAIAAILDIPQ
jgi:hypothetical protein